MTTAHLVLPWTAAPLRERASARTRDISRRMQTVGAESTQELLHRIRGGDALARERLLARYLPMLRRWAHGRLPARARDLASTDDLIQATLLRAVNQLGAFEYQGSGCFLGYLRHLLLNVLRNEIRRSANHGASTELSDTMADEEAPSPLEATLGRERLRRYEAALARLPQRSQELLVMRIELGLDYAEIADETGLSRDAIRMAIKRAVAELAEEMSDDTA